MDESIKLEFTGEVKKLSIKKGEVLVVLFKDPQLFRRYLGLMTEKKNPIMDGLKKILGEDTPIIILPPEIELETIRKEYLEEKE